MVMLNGGDFWGLYFEDVIKNGMVFESRLDDMVFRYVGCIFFVCVKSC